MVGHTFITLTDEHSRQQIPRSVLERPPLPTCLSYILTTRLHTRRVCAATSVAFRSVRGHVDDDRGNTCSSGVGPHDGSTAPSRDVLRQLRQGGGLGSRIRAGHLHLPVDTCSAYK